MSVILLIRFILIRFIYYYMQECKKAQEDGFDKAVKDAEEENQKAGLLNDTNDKA